MKRVIVCALVSFFLIGCSSSSKDKTQTQEELIVVKVSDLSAPNITLDKSHYEVEVGTKLDVKSYIHVKDNFDKTSTYTINGSYDTNKVGKYTLRISAKDKAGNVANKTISIVVKEKAKPIEPVEPTPSNPSQGDGTNKANTQPQVPKLPTGPKPANAQFLFTNGYTMPGGGNPADVECAKHLRANPSWGGICQGVYDAKGMPIGSEAIFY